MKGLVLLLSFFTPQTYVSERGPVSRLLPSAHGDLTCVVSWEHRREVYVRGAVVGGEDVVIRTDLVLYRLSAEAFKADPGSAMEDCELLVNNRTCFIDGRGCPK